MKLIEKLIKPSDRQPTDYPVSVDLSFVYDLKLRESFSPSNYTHQEIT
jgi:hypothetical protein